VGEGRNEAVVEK
jgi:hypothetical protein